MRVLKVGLTIVVVLGSLVTARPASAKVQRAGSLVYVTETALSRDGVASPNVESQCPTGSKAVGAGGGFSRPSSQALLSTTLLLGSVGVEAGGFNAGGGDRTITSVAVCLRAPLSDTASYASVGSSGTLGGGGGSVACVGTRLGGGGGVTPAASGRHVFDSFPNTTSGYAAGFTGPPVAGTSFTVRTVCIDNGILTAQQVVGTATVPPGGVRSVKVRCPRRTQVVGGGVDSVLGMGFSSSRPIDTRKDRDRTPDDGWSGVAANPLGTDQSFTVHAVCVRRV